MFKPGDKIVDIDDEDCVGIVTRIEDDKVWAIWEVMQNDELWLFKEQVKIVGVGEKTIEDAIALLKENGYKIYKEM